MVDRKKHAARVAELILYMWISEIETGCVIISISKVQIYGRTRP